MFFLWFSIGFPMVSLWFSNGCQWFSYDFPMVFLWFPYGFPIVFLWFSYAFPMAFLWFPMVLQWFPYGFPMVSYGFRMIFLWFSYGFHMLFLWFSYGFPMVLLWFSYGFPMVLLCVSFCCQTSTACTKLKHNLKGGLKTCTPHTVSDSVRQNAREGNTQAFKKPSAHECFFFVNLPRPARNSNIVWKGWLKTCTPHTVSDSGRQNHREGCEPALKKPSAHRCFFFEPSAACTKCKKQKLCSLIPAHDNTSLASHGDPRNLQSLLKTTLGRFCAI